MNATKPKQTTLTVRIDSVLAEQFKKIANENNRTQSLLVRDWITQYVKKNERENLFN